MGPHEGKEHWTVDRRVPLALIYTIIIQFLILLVGGVISYKDLSSHTELNSSNIKTIETYVITHKDEHRDINIALSNMKELGVHLEYLRADIASIKESLEAIKDRGLKK